MPEERKRWRKKITHYFFILVFLNLVLPAPLLPNNLHTLWQKRKSLILNGRLKEAEVVLKEIQEEKLNEGIENLWDYAILLLREAQRAKVFNREWALRLISAAVSLAPDLPYLYFYRGELLWFKTPWDFSVLIKNYIDGLKARCRNVALAVGEVGKWSLIASSGIQFGIFLFCLLLIFKRVPLFLHPLREELKGKDKDLIKGLSRIGILSLPFILHLNLLWGAFAISLILWPFLRRRERGALFLSLLLLVYLVPLPQRWASYCCSGRAQVVLDTYEALYGRRDEEAVKRLERWVGLNPYDRDSLLTLGVVYKREGNWQKALTLYQRLLFLNPRDPQVWNNMGNLLLLSEEVDKAIRCYKRAVELAPAEGSFYYNLSKALSKKSILLLDEADRNFQKAKSLSPKLISDHLKKETLHPNRYLIDLVPSREDLYGRIFGNYWREELPWWIYGAWGRPISDRFPLLSPVLLLLIILILFLVERRGEWGSPWKCALCGKISSHGISYKEGENKVCGECFLLMRGKETSKELKSKKFNEIMEDMRKERRIIRVLSFLPGGAHLWKGYPYRGLIVLVVFFSFIFSFYLWKRIPVSLYPLPSRGIGDILLGGLLFLLFCYLFIKDGRRRENRERIPLPGHIEI